MTTVNSVNVHIEYLHQGFVIRALSSGLCRCPLPQMPYTMAIGRTSRTLASPTLHFVSTIILSQSYPCINSSEEVSSSKHYAFPGIPAPILSLVPLPRFCAVKDKLKFKPLAPKPSTKLSKLSPFLAVTSPLTA